jgi:hypothetical protein
MMSSAEVDAAIGEWGIAQSESMRRERRGSLSSELFDIRGRTWVGFECYYRAAPRLLAELAERVAPEEIGRLMKRPGSRPYYLQLFILMSNYLSAREQRLLVSGRAPEADDEEEAAELHTVVEFFTRVARAYRNDGRSVPSAPEFDQRVLGPEWVATCAGLLQGPERQLEVQRAIAGLQLYGFLLHGEQRDGNFDHGPYELEDGTSLLLHELNDLDNDFLPWAERERPLAVSNVCVAYALRDVEMRFSIFGGCVTDPVDFQSRVECLAVFTVEDDVPRPLEPAELKDLVRHSQELQAALYGRLVEWPQIERTRYGRWLYANHLVPFFAIAGAGDRVEEIGESFRRIGHEAAEEFAAGPDLPAIFHNHTHLDEGSMFSPLAGGK